MILSSLRDLALREGLLQNSDYEPKAVRWVITVGRDGGFLGLTCTDSIGEPRRKPKPKTMSIPRRLGRSSNMVADFLVDKCEYVLGIEPDGKRGEDDLEMRRQLFATAVAEAAVAVGVKNLNAVSRFLSRPAEIERCANELRRQEYASNDLIAFRVDGQMVHDMPEVQRYFSSKRRGKEVPLKQCSLCGLHKTPVDKHPQVQLPGSSYSGVALVSFNSNAFESYGWERNQNAPVCRICADAYTSALTRSLRDGYLNGDGESLLRRSVRLSDDTMAVLWADACSDTLDFLTRCFGASRPEDVKTLLESPKAGSRAAPLTARVHCLLLTGGQGRAVVRAYHTGLVRAVESNVGGWFDSHIAFTNRPLPLSWLLRSLAVLNKDENIPPNLAGEIFLAILFGHPFPRWTLTAALGRCRAEQKVPAARMALLHAYLRRNSSNEDVPMSLDPTNTNPGYLLGRTLAILENMQQSAQRQLNKTITDRYYSAASTRPASVFPSLIRLSNHHLAKLSPGLRFHLSKQLGEALAALPAFPPILSLENQGFFALGYYQQKFQRRDSESEIQPVSVEK